MVTLNLDGKGVTCADTCPPPTKAGDWRWGESAPIAQVTIAVPDWL